MVQSVNSINRKINASRKGSKENHVWILNWTMSNVCVSIEEEGYSEWRRPQEQRLGVKKGMGTMKGLPWLEWRGTVKCRAEEAGPGHTQWGSLNARLKDFKFKFKKLNALKLEWRPTGWNASGSSSCQVMNNLRKLLLSQGTRISNSFVGSAQWD